MLQGSAVPPKSLLQQPSSAFAVEAKDEEQTALEVSLVEPLAGSLEAAVASELRAPAEASAAADTKAR